MEARVTYQPFIDGVDKGENVSAIVTGDNIDEIIADAERQLRLAFYSSVTLYMLMKRVKYSEVAALLYSMTTHYLPVSISVDGGEPFETLCDISPLKVGEAVQSYWTEEQKERQQNHECDNPDCPIDDLCAYLGIPRPSRDPGR